jgi:hypothetical protein
MQQHILICAIFRNREKYIVRWHEQITKFMNYYKDCTFSVSLYENDSTDNTKKMIEELDLSPFKYSWRKSETLQTEYFQSVIAKDRVKNLANARNTCIQQAVDHIDEFDKILFVEPDFEYTLESAIKVLEADKLYNMEIDIVSGVSIMNDKFYDMWATRRNEKETWGKAIIRDGIEPFWSTFSGFCLYNAKPFKEGVRFGWFNNRLKIFDCDTVVICENFREKGYNRIFIETSAIFKHEN